MALTAGSAAPRVVPSTRGNVSRTPAPLLWLAVLWLGALYGCAPADSGDAPEDRGLEAAEGEVDAGMGTEGGEELDVVTAALLPLPEALREGATVLGYGEDGRLRPLRRSDGTFICLADDPAERAFHVACYHESLEPYMARGRELRAEGVTGRDGITRRWEEIEAGRLEMPRTPAALYSLSSEEGAPAGAEDPSLRRLTVLYVRDATAEVTGLPTAPGDGVPWLMFPGTPTAHIMIHD